mmetsp:Transcript_35943/g.92561  ORF Transcript_35943/g.92561 Transcript_35943/m.92561 type:complete len:360 (+) Transcript_35943:370-1449(+)
MVNAAHQAPDKASSALAVGANLGDRLRRLVRHCGRGRMLVVQQLSDPISKQMLGRMHLLQDVLLNVDGLLVDFVSRHLHSVLGGNSRLAGHVHTPLDHTLGTVDQLAKSARCAVRRRGGATLRALHRLFRVLVVRVDPDAVDLMLLPARAVLIDSALLSPPGWHRLWNMPVLQREVVALENVAQLQLQRNPRFGRVLAQECVHVQLVSHARASQEPPHIVLEDAYLHVLKAFDTLVDGDSQRRLLDPVQEIHEALLPLNVDVVGSCAGRLGQERLHLLGGDVAHLSDHVHGRVAAHQHADFLLENLLLLNVVAEVVGSSMLIRLGPLHALGQALAVVAALRHALVRKADAGQALDLRPV